MLNNDSGNTELIARLDTIIAILQLAFKNEIDAARMAILSDPVSASILEKASGSWVDAGELRSSVAKQTNQSERTVSRRVTSLLSQRAIEQSGSGSRVKYRSTGLI